MGPFKGCMMVRSNSPVRNYHVNSNDAGLGIPDGAEDPVVANGCAFHSWCRCFITALCKCYYHY